MTIAGQLLLTRLVLVTADTYHAISVATWWRLQTPHAMTCIETRCNRAGSIAELDKCLHYLSKHGVTFDISWKGKCEMKCRHHGLGMQQCQQCLATSCMQCCLTNDLSLSRIADLAGTSRSRIFSNRSFRAWLEWVMSRVRCPGQLWYSTCMICTAVSVLPVPGGPTTIVNPGCTPDLIASTCKSCSKPQLLCSG